MIQIFEIGDKVEVLDEAISGRVVAIKNEVISIETNDGFTMTFFVNELVKTNNSNDFF
jgi:preprotein translocase subunit YajC